MIISASRRTDIPAFYSDWFFNRLREGFALVRNPFNPRALSKISLRPGDAECIVFWTKNAAPMLKRLDELAGYPFYFQFTLNAYGAPVEPRLPPLGERLETFRRLSRLIGKERVVWRYDPILETGEYTPAWHTERFAYMAERLGGYTDKCVISFLDIYRKTEKNMNKLGIGQMAAEHQKPLAAELLGIARRNGLALQTCAEGIDLPGIRHGSCVDPALISRLLGSRIVAEKDRNQRRECGCVSSVDIGAYNTCLHGCAYCYANAGEILQSRIGHREDSPLLAGAPAEGDAVTERAVQRVAADQTSLF